MKKYLVFFFLLPLTTAVLSQERAAVPLPKVEINGSHYTKLQSSIVNQEYVLQVFLPSGYPKSNKQYPVMYLMDSQWDFQLLASLYGEQYYDGFIPELIVVGVTWGGINPNPDSLRARDYTPTKEARLPQSGGAANFLSFMKKELFPYIESHYRADPAERGLMGCSLGGLFTLYALFSEPGLFKRYVAASPAFGWDREVIYRYEKAYLDQQPTAPARLYMSMGGVERGVPGFERLDNALKRRNYPNLQIKTRILDNTGHSGTKAEGYARGLQYVFERPNIQVDAAMLNELAGKYQFPNGGIIELKTEGTGLALYLGPNNKYNLLAASATEWYANSEFLNIQMEKKDGRISGFTLSRYGNDQFVKRLDR